MSKDVKLNVAAAINKSAAVQKTARNVLPQSVSAAAAAPKPFDLNIKDDYQMVSPQKQPVPDGKQLSLSSQAPPVLSKGSGIKCDPVCEPKSDGSDTDDDSKGEGAASTIKGVREALLESTIHDRMHRYKIAYGGNTLTPTTTVTHYGLANIPLGTAIGDRLTNQVYIKKMFVKASLVYIANGHSGASYNPPCVGLCFYIDKMPTTPGVPPSLFVTDANPPAVVGTIYTNLGFNTNTSRLNAQRSDVQPNNVEFTVLRHDLLYKPEPRDFNLNGNSAGNVTQMPFVKTFEFDLTPQVHNVQVSFADDTATQPCLNAINMAVYTTGTVAGGGYTFDFTLMVQFEDAIDSV